MQQTRNNSTTATMHIRTAETHNLREENLLAIQENWYLDATTIHLAIPAGLRPHTPPSSWAPSLVEALRRLSELTVDQMERAHSLLETYFHARIRCNLYKVQQRRIRASLEVVDVQDAIRSLELMNRGQAMEDGSRSSSVIGARLPPQAVAFDSGSKRKFSVRDEYQVGVRSPPSKVRRFSDRAGDTQQEDQLQSSLSDDSRESRSATPAWSIAGVPTKLRASSVPGNSSSLGYERNQRAYSTSKGSISKQSASIPNLQIAPPQPCTLSIPTPSKLFACSPISALLNFPQSPVDSPTRLPPVSALIQESKASEQSWEESPELQVRRLELEEAQAALEVARQKHLVATNKAAIARLEMNGGPQRPHSSVGESNDD